MRNRPAASGIFNEERAAFLDGMRGWAALMVLGSHLFFGFCKYDRAHAGQWFLRFPCDGTLAVYIFFVLSGFALSTQFIKSKDRGILASLALRRYLRLTIPILASVLLAWALMKAGFMANIRAAALMDNRYLASFYNFAPSFKGALSYSLWDIYFRYQDVFPTSYNRVLWTMSYELYGSGLVFLVLLLFGTLRCRFAVYGACGLLFFVAGQPAMVAFVFGIGLAEFYHHRSYGRLRNHSGALALSAVLLLAGWAYSSLHAEYSPTPSDLPFVALMIVFGVMISQRVKRLFETKVSLFMGHVSFPLYLTHLLVICSFTSVLYLLLAAVGLGGRTALLASAAITLPACLLVARAFQPVETAGISASKRFASAILRRVPVTRHK